MDANASRSRTNVLGRWTHSIGVTGSLASAARSLRRQLWLWPLVAAAVLAAVGWLLYHTVERSMQEKLADELQAILDADLAALEIWLDVQRDNAAATAGDAELTAPLAELAALAARARLFVGVDSAPMHIAAAVGTPVVALFGPSDPQRYGPEGESPRRAVARVDLDCSPCNMIRRPPRECAREEAPECMASLSLDRVAASAAALLRSKA